MEKSNWLVINYNLPTEPSRYRVATWRALKKIGALNIQQSMWVLAYNEENYNALNKISEDIEANNGEAFLMECAFFNKRHEDKLISLFNEIRGEEYREFIDECEKYLREIKKEITIEKFTFAELDEEEEELQKLSSWFDKIKARDIFNSIEGNMAENMLDRIKKSFEEYSELVYNYNNK